MSPRDDQPSWSSRVLAIPEVSQDLGTVSRDRPGPPAEDLPPDGAADPGTAH